MRNFIPSLLLFCYAYSGVDEISLQLNKPIFVEKGAKCEAGGVIKTDEITIYAKNFEYTNEDGEHKVLADGNLLIKFGAYIIIGDSISYDFTEKRGLIINGVGTVGNIISGGKKIFIFEDGSLEIEDAFASASPLLNPFFEITSPKITVNNKTKATTKTMVGKIEGVPVLWLPSFGMTLDPKYKSKPPLIYTMRIENNQYPIFIGRYKMYDNDLLQMYGRLEYRVLFLDKKIPNPEWYDGLGGAIDLDYKSEDSRITFETRNYVSYNTWFLDKDPNRVTLRYRLQGRYKGVSPGKEVETLVQWDKLSDRFMRNDFKTQIFDINTVESTEAYIKYHPDQAYITLYGRPRINDYQGFKQELPSLTVANRPTELLHSKIYLEQTYSASYLNYVYARELQGVIPNFESGRIATILNLYRPFGYGPFNITPRVGFDGIIYSNDITGSPRWLAVCNYGGDANIELEANFEHLSHFVKPFVQYNGLSKPNTSILNPGPYKNIGQYVFSINDGYAELNQLIVGLNNDIYLRKFPIDLPTFALNIRAMKFFGTPSFSDPLSKGDIEFCINYPKVEFGAKFGWNFQENSYDYFNANIGWTINDYFAVSTAYRQRSQYYWRKDNQENYILDSFRQINDLVETPLSDPRLCFVNKLQVQIAPLWTFQVENNVGKHMPIITDLGQRYNNDLNNAKYYIQTNMTLSMLLYNSYRFKVGYLVTNSQKDNAVNFSFDLL